MIYKDTIMALSGLENAQQQAAWLLCDILGCQFGDLLAGDIAINPELRGKINDAIIRLIDGYPLQYLLGYTQFMGLTFGVREGALIPRNETEVLVGKATQYIADRPYKVLDLCCGSGCIGISIAHYCKNARVTCADISEAALAIAQENAALNQVDIDFVQSDLFDHVSGEFDAIVCNPPYIEREELEHLPVQVQYEPTIALDGDEDGLEFYRRIEKECAGHLQKKHKIFFEIGYNQADAVSALFHGEVFKDYNDIDRVVIGEKHV